MTEESPGNAGQHIAGPAHGHRRVPGPVEPDPCPVRNDIDMAFKNHRTPDVCLSCCPGTANRIIRKSYPGYAGKFPGMRGVDCLAAGNRKGKPEGIRIEDCFFAVRGNCLHDQVTLRTEPVAADYHIGFLCKEDQPFGVLRADHLSLQPLEDQVGDRFKDRRCNPDNVRTGPQCPETGKERCTLVWPPADDQHLPAGSLMGFFPAWGKEGELPRSDRAFRFKRDPDIDNGRPFRFRPVEGTDPVSPHPRSRDISRDNLRLCSIYHPDTGGKRLLCGPTAPDPEQGIDNDVCSAKQGSQRFEILAAPERMEADRRVPECSKIMFAGPAPVPEIEIAHVGINPALEIAGRNHSVPAIVAVPAEHHHMIRVKGEHLPGQRPASALHQLELRHAKRNRIGVHHAHPGGSDKPGLHEFQKQVRLHSKYNSCVWTFLNIMQWVFAMM